MSEAQQIASGNHDERVRRGVELLRRDNAMLERQVSVLREALATRALLDGPTVIRQGPVLDAIDQLERENAALHRLIDDPNAMHSHYLRKCNGWEVWQAERIHWFQETVDKLERENAALREKAERYRLVTLRQDADNTALCNKLAALENQTQWECSCGGTDCEGQKENAALRSLLREAITDHVSPYDLPESEDYIARVEAALAKEDKP